MQKTLPDLQAPPTATLSTPHPVPTPSLDLPGDPPCLPRESEVAQSCPTLCDPVDYSPPGSSVHGILQASILEWVAISFSNFFLWLSSIPLYVYIASSLSIHLMMDIWVDSMSCLLEIVLL